MAIEQLGESLLAQARQKSKKREKKTKLFTGAMLGVLGGNMYLRSKAKKRVKEINESFQPVLNTHVRRFNEGVDFWSGFNSMLTRQNATVDTWKEAHFNQELKKFKAGQNFKDDFNTEQEIRDYVREQIKDDQDVLQNKLNAYSEFKHYTKSKDDKTKYLRPINKALTESQIKIANNANVGSSLLKALGLKEKDHLQRIISGDTSITLEGVTDQTADKLAAFLSSQNQNRLTLEKSKGPLSETVYGVKSPDPITLESFYKEKKVERFKINTTVRTFVNENIKQNSGMGEKIKLTLKDPNNTEDFSDEVFTETLTFHDLYSKLAGNKDSTEAYKFEKDFIERASRKAEYELAKGDMPDYLVIKQETLNELGKNFILEEKTGIGYNLKYKQSTIEEHIVNSGGPQNNADFNDINGEMNRESVRKEFQEAYNNETDSTRKEFIFEQAEKAGIVLDTNVPTIRPADDNTISTLKEDQEPSWLQDILDGKNYTIKPEKIEELRKLSDENVKDFKSSYKSFVSNIESGASEMFNSIAKIDEDIISGELQRKLISSISKTIGPVLEGKTILQQDFSDTIKVFARNNNIRLEDIVSALDYDWLYKSTGVKNRNIGRRERQAREDKIRKERLLLEQLQEQVKGTGTDPQTGMPSLLSPRLQKEALERRRLGLSDRGIL